MLPQFPPQAVKYIGSARLLHGLTGTVIANHPIVDDWVKVRLDENTVTTLAYV